MTELFNGMPPLAIDFNGVSVQMAECYPYRGSIITILEGDLTVPQARALRDWLNKVLPDQPSREPHGNQ